MGTKKPGAGRTASKQPAAAPPWDRPDPKGKAGHRPLSAKAKAAARRKAKAAGRPYPNLVDNMNAARTDKD